MEIRYSSRGGRRAWAFSAIAVIAAFALACSAQGDVPLLERHAQQINRVVMCPVCPGESIDQSQHPLSVQMRAIVADKLDQGWTEDMIKSLFVESYGPRVLLEPPRQGFDVIVWLVPPAALALAALVLYAALRFMRDGRGLGKDSVAARLSEEDRERYLSRVEVLAYEEMEGSGEAVRPRGQNEEGRS